MRPAQVLDCHADLVSRLDDDRFYAVTTNCYALDFGWEGPGGANPEIRNEAMHMTNLLKRNLGLAYDYQVTDDMSVMVQHAAAALDADDKFDSRLAPTAAGFVRFETPLKMSDVRGDTLSVHWLSWGPATVGWDKRPATMLTFWNDHRDGADAPDTDGQAATRHFVGRWNWCGANVVVNGSDIGDVTWDASPEQVAEIESLGMVATPASNPFRYVHALWLMLGQRVTALHDGPMNRTDRRRAERRNLPSRVTVVALRSTESQRAEGESLVEWSHRWPVRPHWRWQPYGARKGIDHAHVYGEPEGSVGGVIKRCTLDGCDAYVERIFINLYIKGPDGAPLIASEKLYLLRR